MSLNKVAVTLYDTETKEVLESSTVHFIDGLAHVPVSDNIMVGHKVMLAITLLDEDEKR